MDKKIIIVIAVIVVIAIAAVAAFVLLSSGSHSDNDNTLPCKLRVLGNANHDNYLNDQDVTYIQNIIDGKTHWDRVNEPLVDANNDGIINSADVALVKKFINGQAATMYYMDWNNQVSSISYPLTNVLGSNYGIYTEFSTGLDMGIILGIYDRYTYMANGDIGPSGLDTTMYPNASKIKEVGIKNPGLDNLYANGVRILTGDPKFIGSKFAEAEKLGFTCIKLPQNRTLNGVDCLDTLITMGAMFNKQDKTQEFIKFMDKVNTKVSNAVDKAGVTPLSYIIVYDAPGYYPAVYVDAHGTGSMTTADVTLLERLPVTSKVSTTAADGFDEMTADQIVAYNPDIFVLSMFGYASGKDYTVAQYKAEFKKFMDLGFDKSTAGKNKNLYAMPFENCSLAGIASILVLGSMIWPDAFDADEAWDMMQEYYDKFTNFSGDVKNSKFAPLKYSDL